MLSNRIVHRGVGERHHVYGAAAPRLTRLYVHVVAAKHRLGRLRHTRGIRPPRPSAAACTGGGHKATLCFVVDSLSQLLGTMHQSIGSIDIGRYRGCVRTLAAFFKSLRPPHPGVCASSHRAPLAPLPLPVLLLAPPLRPPATSTPGSAGSTREAYVLPRATRRSNMMLQGYASGGGSGSTGLTACRGARRGQHGLRVPAGQARTRRARARTRALHAGQAGTHSEDGDEAGCKYNFHPCLCFPLLHWRRHRLSVELCLLPGSHLDFTAWKK